MLEAGSSHNNHCAVKGEENVASSDVRSSRCHCARHIGIQKSGVRAPPIRKFGT